MEAKRYKFHVNTSSSCFLCLKEILKTDNNFNGNSFSLKNVFQYLNIELSRIGTLSKKPVQLLNKTDIRVSLCSECAIVFKEVSKLYKDIEIAQMKLNWNFEAIQKRVRAAFSEHKGIYPGQVEESTGKESLRHSKLVKELRQEIMDRCSQKMPNFLPRVSLEQVPDSLIQKLTDKGQQEIIDDFNELPDQSEIDDESEDFLEESHPVLCKVNSIKSEHKDHSTDRENVETDHHINLGEEICKVNSLAQHKKESPLQTWKNGSKRKKCLSTGSTVRFIPVGLRTCHICRRILATKQKLQNHLRTHTKERPFECQFCSKSFSYRDVLQRHLIVTHADSLEVIPQRWLKYQCKTCKKLCATKYDFEMHLNTHKTSKQFKCNMCGKEFKMRKSLKHHLSCHEMTDVLDSF